MKFAADIIPEQQSGAKTDVEEKIKCATIEDATKVFNLVKQRLINVNHWHEWGGKLTAEFLLTDEHGNPLATEASVANYIRINIPAPGSLTGRGYDWVKIEAIQEGKDSENKSEYFFIRVRPAENPEQNNDPDTAHFFTSEATSTFLIEKEGRIVSASVHGRNEKPNIKAGNLIDKARNAIIGTGAMAGLSAPQWKALVKGLISDLP